MRQQLISLLRSSSPTVPIYSTRVEAVTESAISVQTVSSTKTRLAGVTYQNVDQTSIIINVVQSDNYDSGLDVLVNWVVSTILTNAGFCSTYYITKLSVDYNYGQTGETNGASAVIVLTATYQETIEPVISTQLSSVDIKHDFISPISRKEQFVDLSDYLNKPDGIIDFEQNIEGLQ